MISVLFPTTGRPERAKDCLQGLRDTTQGHDVEIVAVVDADSATAEAIEPLVDVLLYSDSHRGCSQAWNDALAASTGDPVVFAADDLVWHPGWFENAAERLSQFPDGWGLVGFNDGHWDAELSTHYVMSRRFVVEVLGGVVAWPEYKHSYNDLETCERAKRAGRYAWCEEARVTHEHWLWGTRERDDTDTRRLGDHPADTQRYRIRAAAGFPSDYPAVIQA